MPHQTIPGIRAVAIRYRVDYLAEDQQPIDAFREAGVYDVAQLPVEIVEPQFPEDKRSDETTENLGILGGVIADEVAAARRADQGILISGGDCNHLTGVLGGLQDAHGPTARIGLVWFDAHGDFNTPRTTLTGLLGGMPVAVSAGLAYAHWRERSHLLAPIPTDRIVMVDVRNLDKPEEQLIRATDVTIVPPSEDFPGESLRQAINQLAERCEMLYLHVDSDILDRSYVPNHLTSEPNGPGMAQVLAAIDIVMATGKVVAFGVLSTYADGDGADISIRSSIELLRGGIESWQRHGMPVV